MPDYAFKCNTCKSLFCVVMTITEYILDNSKIKCSKCNSKDISRVLSIPSVVYKGDGFYSTDSKKEATSNGDTT